MRGVLNGSRGGALSVECGLSRKDGAGYCQPNTKNHLIGDFSFSPAAGYSPRTGLGPSTIAAGGLNFCVRNGNRCNPAA